MDCEPGGERMKCPMCSQEVDSLWSVYVATIGTKFVPLLTEEIKTMADLIMAMFDQACLMSSEFYDHQCILAYEQAQAWLIEHGMITSEQCVFDH